MRAFVPKFCDSETLKMAQEELIKKLQEEIASLKNEINNVQSMVKDFEHSVTKLKSEVAVSQQVTALLKQELDRQQQYSRRSCLLIKNIPIAPTPSKKLKAKCAMKLLSALVTKVYLTPSSKISTKRIALVPKMV